MPKSSEGVGDEIKKEERLEAEETTTESNKYTIADVVTFLQEELEDMQQSWDQDFDEPPPGVPFVRPRDWKDEKNWRDEPRPEDWKEQLSQIERAIAQLKQGDKFTAQIILEGHIHEAHRDLTGRSLDAFTEGYERDNVRERRQKHLEKLEALLHVLGVEKAYGIE